jgi:hypothetical protein
MGEIERLLKRAYRKKIKARYRAKYRAKYPPPRPVVPRRALPEQPGKARVTPDEMYRYLLWHVQNVHPADQRQMVIVMSQEWADEIERVLTPPRPPDDWLPPGLPKSPKPQPRIFNVPVHVRAGAGAPHVELR